MTPFRGQIHTRFLIFEGSPSDPLYPIKLAVVYILVGAMYTWQQG